MRCWGSLALLAAIRVAIPLAAYAHARSGLPGLPAFTRPSAPGACDLGCARRRVCVALTVVAVGYLGRHASGRRSLGLLAAAFWPRGPVLVGLIAGHPAWTNGQWEVDVGLHNYSEPLSTLLVTSGAALALSPRLTQMRLALAGCALSAATLVKLSNALLATAVLIIVFLRGRTPDTLPHLA